MLEWSDLMRMPRGIDNFREIRDNGYCFVDKSELVSDILADRSKVYLFTRPNRQRLPDIVSELKRTRAAKPGSMKKAADAAVSQIKGKGYYRGMTGRIILYGICFRGKDSAISVKV
ncbi:MAG: AAA family ATPase, partial [Candidatus Methanomethylophilaceae archaeon]|nr:AAA family ATPase [Candidatus Methanomethylophilaceae archaeon]